MAVASLFGSEEAKASTVPETVISKAEAASEWPFAIEGGTLTCIVHGDQKYVFFSEILTPEQQGSFGNMTLPRMVAVTTNPIAYFATYEDRGLYAPFDSLETLIRRLAPYETIGWALCDAARQPLKTEP